MNEKGYFKLIAHMCRQCGASQRVMVPDEESERAVIDAAKEALMFLDGFAELEDAKDLYDSAKDAYNVLRPAVEALQAAERKGP